MAHKSETLAKFKIFKAEVKNVTKKKIQELHWDNSSEYVSTTFNEFCKAAGIHRQFTQPYSPHQNGISEQWNHSLQDFVVFVAWKKSPGNLTG